MRVHTIDTSEVVLVVSPEDCLRLAQACLTARRCTSGEQPDIFWSPLLTQIFDAMAATFDSARRNVILRQLVAAGDHLDEEAEAELAPPDLSLRG